VTGHEEEFESAADNRSDEQECLASVEQTKHRVNRLLEYLDPRAAGGSHGRGFGVVSSRR
jgi:hypothetical protein